MKWRRLSIAMVLFTLILTSTTAYSELSPNDPLMLRSMKLLKELQELNSKGINVTQLVYELNKAVQLAGQGKRDEAGNLLNSIEENVTKLQAIADYHYHLMIAYKVTEVSLILSFPIIFYFGFPRLYIYVWFRLRRRWLVKDGSS